VKHGPTLNKLLYGGVCWRCGGGVAVKCVWAWGLLRRNGIGLRRHHPILPRVGRGEGWKTLESSPPYSSLKYIIDLTSNRV